MTEKYWLEISKYFPFVFLHNPIIMPNHVHGIIEIAKSNDGFGMDGVLGGDCDLGGDSGVD